MPRWKNCASGWASRAASWLARALRKLGLPRQKKIPRSQEQDRPDVQEQRQEFCAKLAGVDPRRRVVVDESGANTAMTRTHGRAPVGQRVYTNTPGRWESITMTCGLRLSGVTAPLAVRGATHTDIFATYVQDVLVPELKPGEVVLWDHLKPHQSEEAIEAIEAAGASVEPLPPWSPDLTPIEEMVSKLKEAMRSAAARTTEAVYRAFASGLQNVTLDDIAGWFRSRAAYAMQLWGALDGVRAPLVFPGATDTQTLQTDVDEVLAPEVRVTLQDLLGWFNRSGLYATHT
jgi:transposase